MNWFSNQLKISSKVNIKVVILCFIGASTFWFFNSLNKDYTSDINIPIDFQFDSDDHVVLGELPSEVEVNVSGLGWDLLRAVNLLSPSPIEVPLSDPTIQRRIPGQSLNPYVMSYLNGQLELNYIVTDTLYLNIDRKVNRVLGIAVDTAALDLENSYERVSPVSIERDSVFVEGPQQILDTLRNPYMIRLSDRAINSDYDERISLPISENEYVECEPPTVRVRFSVEELIENRIRVGYELVNFPEQGVGLSDTLIELRYLTRAQLIDSVQNKVRILVDYNLVSWEDSTVTPMVREVPPFVREVEVTSPPLKLIYE